MTTDGPVHLAFPWNHYPDGRPTAGIDAGKMVTVRMRMKAAPTVAHCTACGVEIPAGADRYVLDYPGVAYAIDPECEKAKTARGRAARVDWKAVGGSA